MYSKENLILYSKHESLHISGVTVILSKNVKNMMTEWYPVNNRILAVKLNSTYAKTTLIQVYAPTNQATYEDACYEKLQSEIK